jgi:hypothetical protein
MANGFKTGGLQKGIPNKSTIEKQHRVALAVDGDGRADLEAHLGRASQHRDRATRCFHARFRVSVRATTSESRMITAHANWP